MTKFPLKGLLMASTLAFVVQQAGAQTSESATATATPADNTKSNKLDSSNMAPTAGAQKEDSNDLGLTKRIRQSVMADKSISSYAHNIKIISVNGNVTLNGVVHTEEERRSIEMKAASFAGKDKVTNELKVVAVK